MNLSTICITFLFVLLKMFIITFLVYASYALCGIMGFLVLMYCFSSPMEKWYMEKDIGFHNDDYPPQEIFIKNTEHEEEQREWDDAHVAYYVGTRNIPILHF